ncbi:alpha/beta-hydrolase [Polyplosphaeria fusca]|uniref:Alpha/beta-hydrolase n=1 Tax=Polyplosphaeria fusca TaxID=682080 RepID=A0A9P4UZJ0_9PLEO|nr:alpha/beta-hydrolase [Polyplosphaeria fusca]
MLARVARLRRCRVRVRRRPFSAVSAPPRQETIVVPCRSNGSITVDVHHAPAVASPTLIYLPPGPVVPEDSDAQARIISTLAQTTGATIACINYRLSPSHQFPTPIHDVLEGYDWVAANLARKHLERLGVCAELVGASLATMLALTECRKGGPRIGAAAVNNPIGDWVFPDDLPHASPSELLEPDAPEETAYPANGDLMTWWAQQDDQEAIVTSRQRPKRAKKQSAPSAWTLNSDSHFLPTLTLSGERDVLFQKAEHFFDRFASPIHFFRSPHGKLLYPQDEDTLASASPSTDNAEESVDLDVHMSIDHYESLENISPGPPDMPTLVRCRSYARVYPPSSTNLDLPFFRISAGSQSPLLDQSTELAKHIKRSIMRQRLKARAGRVQWHDQEEKAMYEEVAGQMVSLELANGVGLWSQLDHDPLSQSDVENAGRWLAKAMVAS